MDLVGFKLIQQSVFLLLLRGFENTEQVRTVEISVLLNFPAFNLKYSETIFLLIREL